MSSILIEAHFKDGDYLGTVAINKVVKCICLMGRRHSKLK